MYRQNSSGKLLRTALRALLLKSADSRITGRLTREMVKVIKADVTNPNISSKAKLFEHFKFIQQNIRKGILPFIHFETHGCEEGIQLNNYTEISWQELVPSIRQINLLTKNNLFISMASCQGGNIQFCVKITEPSPCRGFIGPMEDVGEKVWCIDGHAG